MDAPPILSTASQRASSRSAIGWKISSKGASPDLPGPGEGNERKREPLAHERNVARPEQRERIRLHRADVRRELLGVVAGTASIRPGNEDHEGRSAVHGGFIVRFAV